jgi:hypothetical protein
MLKNLILCVFSLLFGYQLDAQSISPQLGTVRVEMDPSTTNTLYLMKQKGETFKELKGFRVQIFNGDKSDCLKQRGRFLKVYRNIPAYLLYEAPEYRTQIGDFRTRLEAEAFLKKIINNFAGSFVVPANIKYPRYGR